MNKLYFITDKTSTEMKAINEVLPILDTCDDVSGTPVMLKRRPEGLCITKDTDGYTIEYSTRASLMRAVGLLVENLGKKSLNIEEYPKFDCLGTMPDCSRNAVPTVETLKEWLRMKALMGFNAMMLYTEDTFEMEGHPHFGYMRGRYTKQEIKEIDDYAYLLGIELVPCIQTLAHLKTIFQWPEYLPLRDVDTILMAEDEDVYKLIDDMLDTCANNFRSRRINLGMDEAFCLGSGKYMGKNGYKPRREIMKTHLEVLMEKCNARGLKPMIWSDMFFRMLHPKGLYYNMELEKVPQEMIDIVPEGLELLYWDYYSINKARYDHMFDLHLQFKNNPIGFAGGAANWYGVTPLNAFSVESARVATTSAIEKGEKEAWITMWGDDGGECAHVATLPTLIIYAEACWSGDTSDENAEKRMMTCSGASFLDFLKMEEPNNVPSRTNYKKDIGNPYKPLLYQDILAGKFDCHIPEGLSAHFKNTAKMLKKCAAKTEKYAVLFNTLIELCNVLELKSDIGVKLKKAYDENDKAALKKYANKVLPELISRYEAYYDAYRTQWYKYNKPFGFEIQDMRFGGLILRAKNAISLILDYVDGKIDSIPELAEERVPYDPERVGMTINHIHYHEVSSTSNVYSKHTYC